MRRTKVLDKLCQKITGSETQEEVLVAFGDAESCSKGFGAPPAPLGALRHRLVANHKARVTLVHEHLTSQICSRCLIRKKMNNANARHSIEKIVNSKAMKRRFERNTPVDGYFKERIHGVKFCDSCSIKKCGHTHPLFHHRDKNAAINIMMVYDYPAEYEMHHLSFPRV